MDWALFFSTFVTIFLAELGDKTQFAAVAAASQSEKTWPVLLAVVTALGAAGTLGVLFGKTLGLWIRPEMMRYLSGGLFILVGTWILFKK